MIRKIGILTSGGDSPGMNAAVVSVARCAAAHGIQLMGIKRGYNGLLGLSENPEDDIAALDLETVLDIADQRGTFLRTARCDEFKKPEVQRQCANNLRKLGIDALVVIGGDGSFNGAMHLSELGIPCVGIPGTIDNDIACSEYTIGYDTAMNTAVEAIDKLRDTTQSHDRCSVVEVMGHHAGYIALNVGIATGALAVLLPERPFDFERDILSRMGVTEIESLGQKFDPALHNAVMHEEDETKGEGEIVQELQRGFKMGDKVIRFAMVKVAN